MFSFSAKLLSIVKTVALTRAPEKCRWKSRHKFRRTFHTQTHWCRRRGARAPPKLLICANPGKIT